MYKFKVLLNPTTNIKLQDSFLNQLSMWLASTHKNRDNFDKLSRLERLSTKYYAYYAILT